MKKYLQILRIILPIVLGFYIVLVGPDITKPLTIFGFFGLLFLTIFALTIGLFPKQKFNPLQYIIAFMASIGTIYILAMSSLGSMSLYHVGVVFLVFGLVMVLFSKKAS
jgi:hypothetical protein